jgi:membrane protease YdiL (CAAX protease family)
LTKKQDKKQYRITIFIGKKTAMKHKSNTKLTLELLFLYVALPISFCFSFPIYIKLGLGILSFIYLLVILSQNKYVFYKKSFKNYSQKISLQILITLAALIIITTTYLKFTNPDALFNVIKAKPTMWIAFICIYSFLSVIPQEIIYRSFYFERYKNLFTNEKLFILSNALVFSLGHLFFNNLLVNVITFIGGLIFAYTYNKTKSLILVSIEHAIYGCWLYTVGFGEVLGFPTP